MPLYAHTNHDPSGQLMHQTLQEHLSETAHLASGFAAKFGMGSWGTALGILHDSGKASQRFQERLMGASHLVDHATAGAKEAVSRYEANGMLMAYALAGHHGGQPDGSGSSARDSRFVRTPLDERLKREVDPYNGFLELVETGQLALPAAEDLSLPIVPGRVHGFNDPDTPNFFSFYVLGRMLHSCLVDADSLDTERVMNPAAAQARSGRTHASLSELLQKLMVHIEGLNTEDTPVNRARAAVLEDCLEAASFPQGMFTLTVPTGGGKTLSGLAFALAHAIEHGQERVIITAPFTTIISQTASRLKAIFGDSNVLEHHSNYDFSDMSEDEGYAARLAAQNWDAPIIVTTNVQLFESLFANKPAKSRKIHNIANSVVILDEAQTLPDSLLIPSLAMLEELTFAYSTSIVLCSATQPALGMQWPYGSQPQEIVSHRAQFSQTFGSRVRYDLWEGVELNNLAHVLAEKHQVLCVVGTKGNALAMYLAVVDQAVQAGLLDSRERAATEGFFHLSAFMTPAHREKIIEEIRCRLVQKERCVVVSTQLVEAGVDVDFPEVFREVAGMDSIVQAAGRCNREGASEPGSVHVFDLLIGGERGTTSSWLEKMRSITLSLIDEHRGVIDESMVQPFFERRYRSEETDAKEIFKTLNRMDILHQGFATIPFERVSLDYRIIEEDTVPLFVSYEDSARSLLKEMRGAEHPELLTMKAQRHSVSIPRWLATQYEAAKVVEELGPFLVIKEDLVPSYYKADVGLLKPGEEEPEFLWL